MPTSANIPCASADPGRAPTREPGGPHGGGPHGTALHLGTRSRHGRRAPRGAPLHGGGQQQIRGSVPSFGARVLEVRIHLPPAQSQLRTSKDDRRQPETGNRDREERWAAAFSVWGPIPFRPWGITFPVPQKGSQLNFSYPRRMDNRWPKHCQVGETAPIVQGPSRLTLIGKMPAEIS